MSRITKASLISDFSRLGINPGDTILIRAALSAVGRIEGGAAAFVEALVEHLGPSGTVVSLSFTGGSFVRLPKREDAFSATKKSSAGGLPNAILAHKDARRSRHPMCSYVAIGRLADEITRGHDENSPAYEPIRKIVEADGKNILVGCVSSSPGFTTTHLAESDLGHLKLLAVFPRLRSSYFVDRDGNLRLFRRRDPGLCSNSFYKFYALYVKSGILVTGRIGDAYSILAPAKECFRIDLETLNQDRKFNLCGSKDCWTCNAGRWDRIHRAPLFFLRKIFKKIGTRNGK